VPRFPNHTGWSGYTTYITKNVKGQPTSTEYYADARWTVPKLDCNPIHHPIIGSDSAVGIWIGLGGVPAKKDKSAGHLVQAGILARCNTYRAVYDAVYQILPPDKSVIFLGAKYPVKPGNFLEVTVERHLPGRLRQSHVPHVQLHRFPAGHVPTCGPSFLNLGYAFRFIGLTASNQPLTKVGQITSPVSDKPRHLLGQVGARVMTFHASGWTARRSLKP